MPAKLPGSAYQTNLVTCCVRGDDSKERFYLDDRPLPIYVNRVIGSVRIGCHRTSVEVLRKLLARVEAALTPSADEVEI